MPRHANPDLTERERQAFKYLAEGKRYADIGQIMGLSAGRVRNLFYCATIKLNAETKDHALALLVKGGKL